MASGTGKTPASGATGVNSFLAMLGLATSDGAHEGGSGVDEQNKATASAATPSGFFPVLATSDIKGLLQALETMVGGTGGATAKSESLPLDSSGVNDSSATRSSSALDQQVEKLILGLLALVVAKQGSTGGAASGQAADDQNTDEAQGSGPSAARQGTAKNTTASESDASASSDGHSTQATTGSYDPQTLETLALLVFHSLQAVLQGQNQVEPITGGGANGALSSAGGPAVDAGAAQDATTGDTVNGVASESGSAHSVNGTDWQKIIDQAAASGNSPSNGTMTAGGGGTGNDKQIPAEDAGPVRTGVRDPLRQSLEAASTKEASPKEKAGGLLNDVSVAGKAASVPAAEDKSSGGPSIGLTPAGDDGPGMNGLTLVIKGPQGSTQYAGPGGVAGEMTPQNGAGGSQQVETKDDSMATTIIHDLSPLLESQGENASKGDTGDKEQPSGRENYQLAGGNDFGSADSAVQEQSGKVSERYTTGEAVEKFQQVLDQFGGKTDQHNLTVKLDIGSEGSLVLGMKDLGQTVTVEVRASHDATVNLLQSQRDTIIRHLEGKDVHTNIVIDPNASGTPEKRDRRDMKKQRTFPSAPKEDEGFGELLEILV